MPVKKKKNCLPKDKSHKRWQGCREGEGALMTLGGKELAHPYGMKTV